MANTAEQNLIVAEMAVDHVRQKMTKGASNKPIDLVHAQMRHKQGLKTRLGILGGIAAALTSPDLTEKSVTQQRRTAPSRPATMSIRDRILADALRVEGTGIGNCGEQTAVGFRYLAVHKKFSDPFCYVNLHRNHACLVLGARRSDVHGTFALASPPPWPAGAVICDPWFNEWFRVDLDWTRKVRSILAVTEPGPPPDRIVVGVVAEFP